MTLSAWLDTWPIISDPHFYAWAVPAALILGVSKSGFASGVGSITTPLVAMAVAVPQAAAIMLPLLALSDLLGMSALRHGADWRLLRLLMPTALLGIVAGWAALGCWTATWWPAWWAWPRWCFWRSNGCCRCGPTGRPRGPG